MEFIIGCLLIDIVIVAVFYRLNIRMLELIDVLKTEEQVVRELPDIIPAGLYWEVNDEKLDESEMIHERAIRQPGYGYTEEHEAGMW